MPNGLLPPLQPAPRPPLHAIAPTTTPAAAATSLPTPIQQHPHLPSALSPPTSSSLPETRTLLTFPTPGLPSPRIIPVSQTRPLPVRYPPSSVKYSNSNPHNHAHIISTLQTTSNLRNLSFLNAPGPPSRRPQPDSLNDTSYLPTQIQTNRWLCCQCAEEGFIDPVGTVHLDHLPPFVQAEEEEEEEGAAIAMVQRKQAEMYSTCLFRPGSCSHKKCPNCVLYAGPASSRDPVRGMKFLVRTVGGLYTSGRFVDPVRWECGLCGEWESNKIDGAGGGCKQQRRERGWGGWPQYSDRLRGNLGSVVMNRYGQRLGTADQRVAFEGGPWDWHRRALADHRCVLSKGFREVLMRRPVEGGCERKVWREGEPVPSYEYRRPPPLDEDDERENSEYEGGFLAGLPVERVDKGKGKEREVEMGMGRGMEAFASGQDWFVNIKG
ncbi:hypothetical protein QBC36DRAFT_347387 [Triangularia setosa]|uniref:Uncharacterized protein n=1 Tax=Triangularia setosa TaxID=2587417 RepID=A0AAN6W473_9PEZI|nr:hypothetical protein QBC36DRAFT_347387 [Podospora setosa]